MSFLYDRDYNVTGTVQTTFDFKPSYGTTVNFKSDYVENTTIDNYLYIMPRGINHLQMSIDMPFENRTETEATKIASFFENLRGTGYFTFTDPAQIYKPIQLFCEKINTNFVVNDIYSLQVELFSDQSASLLNWASPFITGENLKGYWATGVDYKKYDVIRFTGDSNYTINTGNYYDSFYYCTNDHFSNEDLSPVQLQLDWSQDLFLQPTYQTQVNKETSILKSSMPYSFKKRSDFGLHANTIKSLKLDYKGVTDREARYLLHFLCSRHGYMKFQYSIPKIYNKNKYFFCPEWSHTFVYKNVNDISLTLIEDPLGVKKSYEV